MTRGRSGISNSRLMILGVMLAAGGMLLMVGVPTGAFTDAVAERTTTVEVTNTSDNALLQIETLDNPVVASGTNEHVRVTNNAQEQLDITGSVTVTGDNDQLSEPSIDLLLDSGNSEALSLDCADRQNGERGTATVSVSADATASSDSTLSIQGAVVSGTVEYDCVDESPAANIDNVADKSQCSDKTGNGDCINTAEINVAEFQVDWSATDDYGIDSVTLELVDSGGTVVDSASPTASGTSASGTTTLSDQGGYGDQYDITLTVADSAGQQSSDSRTETATGSGGGGPSAVLASGSASDLSGDQNQTQTLSFTLESDLGSGDEITIDLTDTTRRRADRDIAYSNPGSDTGQSVSISGKQITYTADGSEAGGETVTVTVEADPGLNAHRVNEYTVEFIGPDSGSVTDTFSVTQ